MSETPGQPTGPFSQWPYRQKPEYLEQLSLYARMLHDHGNLNGHARQLMARLETAAHNVATTVDPSAAREVTRQPWPGLRTLQKVEHLRQISRWADEQGRWGRELTPPQQKEHLALARHTEGFAHVLERRERERERAAR